MGQLLSRPLGVAAGGHNQSAWVFPAQPAQGLPRFAVGSAGHGAGINDHHVGLGRGVHHLIARCDEGSGQRLTIRLVELATLSVYGYLEPSLMGIHGVSVNLA